VAEAAKGSSLAWSPETPTRTTGSTVRSGAKHEVRKEGASVEMGAGVVIYTVVPNAEGFALVTGDAGLWTGEAAEADLSF
jgi:hypothetical protein